MKLTKVQKKKVAELLLRRWATIIEEDPQTDGFHDDVAHAMGLQLEEVPTEAHRYASAVVKEATRWLLRLPEVP